MPQVILGDDGQKLSKRRGAVSVTAYEESGFLPEAMLNYLARLGWSHGDEELFTREQLVSWFDGSHLSKSPAQWDAAKLNWVNAHYLKTIDEGRLAALVATHLKRSNINASKDEVARLVPLFKDRCSTTVELADWVAMYFADVQPKEADIAAHVTDVVKPALNTLREKLAVAEWTKASISAAIRETIAAHGLKMPQLAHAVRVKVCGRAQTPSIDAVLELFPRELILARLHGP